jgi:pyruvate kinase
MMRAGMNVARLNLSHGTHKDHHALIRLVRAASLEAQAIVPLIGDLQGPKIRLGELPKEGVSLRAGEEVILVSHKQAKGTKKILPVIYPRLAREVKPKHRILIDDGLVEMVVQKIIGERVVVRVQNSGVVTSHKGLNFPDTALSVSSLTSKDVEDVKFVLEEGLEWIALSFVTSAKDVQELKHLLNRFSKAGDLLPRIMVKIEKQGALKNFDAILKEADGVMIARGDLGTEIPAEEVPLHQKTIIEQCRLAGKPVVVATQMLNSMRENPRPTRAEVSDVANAVCDHASAVMLSGETANGKYPLEAVEMMQKIVLEAEASPFDDVPLTADRPLNREASIAQAIKVLSLGGHIDAVLGYLDGAPWSESMLMAHPEIPLFLGTSSKKKMRQAQLGWGVEPFYLICTDKNIFVVQAMRVLKKLKKISKGMRLAVVGEGQGIGLEIVEVA